MATNSHTHPPPSSSQPRLRLPRQLLRPRSRPIDIRAIVAIDPVYADIPLSYIQHVLEKIGPPLLCAMSSSTATPPTGQVPRELRLVCNDVSVEPPSHIIAAYGTTDNRIVLFPVHAIILVTNCAHLPTLPISRPDTPAAPGGVVTLPVIPLRLPSPASFPILLSYLYTKRPEPLLAELLTAPSTSSIAQLARAQAAAFPVQALVANILKAQGLWNNASALGISDDKLFQALELAWEVLLQALGISTGQSVEAGITVDGELE
ncbi:hypothetical protein JB92DRAFT_2716292 [Gautieria morchelliformis]|nr:hypothetical protein JB92DRAFT_2716292 [Gautieria morchelliformis]